MLRQIKLLSALELKNVFGINQILHTKDKTKKRNAVLVGIVWCALIAMVFFYVGSLTWGLVTLGLSEIVGAYLTMNASFVILAFGIFKAGGAAGEIGRIGNAAGKTSCRQIRCDRPQITAYTE